MVLYDRLWRYHARLSAGEVEADLSLDEREQVSYLLGCTINILSMYGATDIETLVAMSIDRQRYSARVCDRVSQIIREA
jgi:hypothetical protein